VAGATLVPPAQEAGCCQTSAQPKTGVSVSGEMEPKSCVLGNTRSNCVCSLSYLDGIKGSSINTLVPPPLCNSRIKVTSLLFPNTSGKADILSFQRDKSRLHTENQNGIRPLHRNSGGLHIMENGLQTSERKMYFQTRIQTVSNSQV
jgi:hypothetical protein